MEQKSLKDYALMCECSQKVANFSILADFLKKGIMDVMSYKSVGKEMPLEEKNILEEKYSNLLDFMKEIL